MSLSAQSVKVYTPHRTRSVVIVVVCFGMALLLGRLFLQGGLPQGNYFPVIMLLGTIAVLVGVGVLLTVAMIRQVPKLTLSADGIEYAALAKTQFWAWKDVGPFRYQSRYVGRSTVHVLCAFHDLTHDSLEKLGHDDKPGIMNAEIVLNVLPFKGLGFHSFDEMEAEVNRWRDHFGSPGNDAAQMTADHIEQRAKQIRRKGRKQKILIFLVIIAVPFLVTYCKDQMI